MGVRFKQYVALLAAVLLPAVNAFGLTGSWRGELVLGQMKLSLVFNFSETAEGETQCTLDSPSQGAKDIPAVLTLCSADSLSLTCTSIRASYSGKIMSGCIKGTFKQNAYSFPLDLTPDSRIEERRPQTPKPPFPYSVVDTTFFAPDGVVMSATLIMPEDAQRGKKVSAVVMVTGSGPQNRDEELFEHRPFAVLADYLARNGVASLRYDDRGFGKSGGNFQTATTSTFKDDAKSGIEFLRSIGSIDKVGVLGHSEGGTIAFMLGAEDAPDFVISLAGMAVSGKETLMRQNSRGLERMGLQGSDKDNSLKLIEMVFDTMAEQNSQGVSTPIDIDSIVNASGLTVNPQVVSSLKMTQKTRTPWLDAFVGLEPEEYIKNVKCPILAINGEKDTQVEADNLRAIEESASQAEVRLMPGLNHLMQHAVTGEVGEYGEIRETISPEVLEAIARFIRKQE